MSKWFKHDTDAATDAKLKRVRHRYGFEGYGLYFYCLERIGAQLSVENLTFSLDEDPDLIALDWRTDESRVADILNYMVKIGLFTRDESGRIVCFNMARRIDKSMTSNPQMREIIEKIRLKLDADDREGQPHQAEIDMTQPDSSMTTSGKPMSGSEKPMPDKSRLDKSSLDKNNKYSKLADNLGVGLDLIERIVKHRRDIKAPANTDKKIALVISDFKKCIDAGFFKTLDQAMDKLDETSWRTLKPEYMEGNGFDSKPKPRDDFSPDDYGGPKGDL